MQAEKLLCKKQVSCFNFEMLCGTAEVLVVLSSASLRAGIRGEAGSILPDDGNGMKRWSSCPSSHGVLVAELAGLYLIPLPNPVPWANADHSHHLMFISDSYWIRTGASLFLLCIAGPVKDGGFYPGSLADMAHSSEQRNKEGWTVASTSLQCRSNWCVSQVASLHSFQFLALPVCARTEPVGCYPMEVPPACLGQSCSGQYIIRPSKLLGFFCWLHPVGDQPL